MASGTLHAAKPDGLRRRRNAPAHPEKVVTLDGVIRGPDLEGPYSEQTFAWYRTWQTAPQAQLFHATDWSRLLLLAPIVDAHFRRPSAAGLSEIRLNEERLGATVVDRMRARIHIDNASENDPSGELVQPHAVGSREDVLARMRREK